MRCLVLLSYFVLIPLTLATLSSCQSLAPSSALAETRFNEEIDFRRWFAFYYQSPKPERLTAAVYYMNEHSYLRDYPDVASVFLGKIIASDPERLSTWAKEWDKLGPEEWNVLLMALWLSDTEKGLALMRSQSGRVATAQRARFDKLATQSPRSADLLTAKLKNPRQINLLWAAFSATGDEKLIRKVISYVHFYDGVGESAAGQIGETAIMTLANELVQHKAVQRICEDENRSNPDPKTRKLLETMFEVVAGLDDRATQKAAH